MPYSSLTQRASEKEPTIHAHMLGGHIREAMERANISGKQMARLLGASESYVSRVITGKVAPAPEDVSAMAALCCVSGERRAEFISRARDRDMLAWQRRDQLATWRSLMTAAIKVDEYGQCTIPDLLRTYRYDHAILQRTINASPADIDDMASATASAAERMFNSPSAARRHYTVILAERVLHLPVESEDVMAEQLTALLSMSVQPGVSIRVIRATAGAHVGLRGSFSVAQCRDIKAACTADELNLHMTDHPEGVHIYARIFDALTAVALEPAESRTVISDIAIRVYGAKPLPMERPNKPNRKVVSA